MFCLGDTVTPGISTDANKQLSEIIDKNNNELREVGDEVSKAIEHARELSDKSLSLDQDFADTRHLTGVRAASAYQDIANDIENAKKFVEEAFKAADNATKMVKIIIVMSFYFK